MNSEKPPVKPENEEEKLVQRKKNLAGAFGGEVTPAETAHVEIEEGENLDPDGDTRNDAVAAQRRDELRERLLRGEEIGRNHDEPSERPQRDSNVGPNGRSILRKG